MYKEYVTKLRREFHQNPELSGQEFETCKRICTELERMNIPYEIVDGTSVVGRIDFGEGTGLAIRADIDALPVKEETGLEWKSLNNGIMHACGHDGHAAILLATAKALLDKKEELYGKIYLCFQKGEEAGIGARQIVEYLKEKGDVQYAIGLHLYGLLPTGQLDLQSGCRATGAYVFKIKIAGKGGHGARPDTAANVVETAADIYDHLIKIPANHHEAAATCVISPCLLQAGERFNVLPEDARIEGTIRFTGENDGEILKQKVRETAAKVADLYGVKADTEFITVAGYPVMNDPAITAIGRKAALECGCQLPDVPATTASDNFGDFLHAFKGFYTMFGAKVEREGISFVHHAPNFDIDEAALPLGVDFFCSCAEQILGKDSSPSASL